MVHSKILGRMEKDLKVLSSRWQLFKLSSDEKQRAIELRARVKAVMGSLKKFTPRPPAPA
jgi:hypothetical protein